MKKSLFFSFCFCCCSFIISAQSMMTIGEVYDYDIGDEFHYSVSHEESLPQFWGFEFGTNLYTHVRMTIADKYYSANADTVFYVRAFNNYNQEWGAGPSIEDPWGYTFYVFNDTVAYTDLDSGMRSSFYVLDPTDTCSGWSDSSYVYPELCGPDVYRYSMYSGSCFEGYGYTKIFGRGLGEMFFYFSEASSYTHISRSLRYYKKQAGSCGTPLLASVAVLHADGANGVYPNPSSGVLHFSNPDLKGPVLVYDMWGRLVAEKSIQGGAIDLSGSASGLYQLRVDGVMFKVVILN